MTTKATSQRGGTTSTTRNGISHRPYCGESTRPSTMYELTIAAAT